MRRTLVLALVTVFVFSQVCGFNNDILPPAGIGIFGLKVYLGMRLLGGSAMMFRNSLSKFPLLGFEDDDQDDEDHDDVNVKDDDAQPATMERPKLSWTRVPRTRAVNSVDGPSLAFPKLNPEILKFIHQIDDDQCFEKFFCQLGADREAFGSFGMNVALMVQFYHSDEPAWYTRAMAEGRKLGEKELCPGLCESEDIRKVVKFVSKQLFSNT